MLEQEVILRCREHANKAGVKRLSEAQRGLYSGKGPLSLADCNRFYSPPERSQLCIQARRRSRASPWIWQIRDSLTFNTAPISFKFNSSS